MPRPTKEIAIRRLQQQLDAIPELRSLSNGSSKFTEWRRDTRVAIAYAFGESSHQVKEFEDISFFPFVVAERYYQEAYVRGLYTAAATLRSMMKEIHENWEDESREPYHLETPETLQPVNTNRVFVVHGRDHGTRDAVARFLEKLGLEVMILEEQPNRGRTVIEKFEEHVHGDFAIALLTPDDVGGLSDSELQPRARQNVIFEFGYCIGKFGRDRVLALIKEAPEIPSDYSGVLYIQIDESGGWQMRLIREMNSAGFNIDANLAL